jgi:hypothetical protein
MKCVLMLGLIAAAAGAQSVQVYSEFARIGDSGDAIAPESPREILSPAIARNAFSSFQIAIQVPKGTKFQLFMGQNPEGALSVMLYRRAGEKLEHVDLPYFSDSTQVLWMDVWVDATAPVRRVKLEPQVYIDGDWVTYPMEVRVSEPVVPEGAREPGSDSPLATLRASLCGTRRASPATGAAAGDVARMQFRNAQQDAALAAKSSAAVREELKKALGGCDAKPAADPEFYLRVRDIFFASPKKVQ